MKKLLFVLVLMHSLNSFAQINYSVKGKVVTSQGYSPVGNVIALGQKDSVFIKGASFFDGNFELRDLSSKEVLIKLSSLEFRDTIILVNYMDNPVIDLGQIVVKTSGKSLGEVVVAGKRPVYTHKQDGTLEITVENTMLSASNSVNEILTKSPEIVLDEEGALSVLGKGRAIIYLNGKRITDNQLSLILPGNVKKVEIIRNPSSKYDAEGAAVINITTIRQVNEGYQASLKQNVNYSDFGGWNTYSSMNVNYRKGRLSSSGNYALQLGKEKTVLHTTRNRDAEDVFLNTDLTSSWNREFDNFSYYGLGLQYDIGKADYISLEYSGSSEHLGGNTLSNNKIVDDSSSIVYNNNIEMNEKNVNNSFSLNYKKAIDTLGSTLFIGGQYSNYSIDVNNLINEESVEHNVKSSRLLKQLQDLGIDVFAGQADYSKAFRSNDVLEIGAKFSKVKNEFDMDFLVSEDGLNYTVDPDRSDNFSYKESVSAGYVSFRSKLGTKIDYAIGVRGEYTEYDLQLLKLNNEPIKNSYFTLLPNVAANIKLSGGYNLNFSYNSRINRPPYQRLNPVLIYQDPYTSAQGNVNLRPEKRHAFELSSKIKETVVKVGYNYTQDPFGQTAIRGADPKSYILKRINYHQENEVFASVSRTFNIRWWTTMNTFTLKYANITEEGLGFRRITPKPNVYFYSNNRFDIADSYTAELMFWYMGDNIEGLHRRNDMYNVTISLGKSFFNNSLKCSLVANDIFHSIIQSGDYFVGQTDVYYNRRASTNYFRLSAIYNFGRLKKVDFKNKSIGKPESERVD